MDQSNLNWSIEYYEKNAKECDDLLKSLENYEKIPSLNSSPLHQFKDETLVRYQGMVQDMLNPEFYYPSYVLKDKDGGVIQVKSGRLRDFTHCNENEELVLDSENHLPKDRLLFFCIPVPGLNSWAQNHGEKNEKPNNEPIPGTSGIKRGADDDMETNEPTKQRPSEKPKIPTTQPESEESTNNAYNNDKYFPIPGQTGLPCIVKIYEDENSCDIILNDRIEVIGFLSLNPALEATWDDSDAEDKELHPPPSLVPRIHVVHYRKLKHCNPLLKQVFEYGDFMTEAERIRSDLHLVLTQILYGDTVAADYVICHLLSRIYVRNESHTLGKYSLNLSNVASKNFGERFYDLLQSLVTNSQYVPLSVEMLNQESFVPKKNYDTNRLWSGRLQLSDDTHLFLDETKMNEGQLNHSGCLNVAAIHALVKNQEIRYDFGYYPVTYNTNLPILVLSEGKSMFETDVRLKLKPDTSMISTMEETFEAARFYLNKELSERIRIYLTSMRLQEFQMSEDMMKKIGEDYASMRQQDRKVTSQDLHNLLVLSRLLAVSYGRTVLTADDWSKAIDMETERKSRSS